jgi:hypothetical protein
MAAPDIADVQGFVHSIHTSLTNTVADATKLARFAAALTGGGGNRPAQIAAAKKSLSTSLSWFDSFEAANLTPTHEGFGRLDAMGRITNQVIRWTSDPKNSIALKAPASYPVVWDAPCHDYVQWTAFVPNAGTGSLGRNVGEVLGVFGQVTVKHYENKNAALAAHPSSVEHRQLISIEESLRKLWSPAWPEQILPPINRTLASRGKTLYATNCSSCHGCVEEG